MTILDKLLTRAIEEHYEVNRRGLYEYPSKKDWTKEKLELFKVNNHTLYNKIDKKL